MSTLTQRAAPTIPLYFPGTNIIYCEGMTGISHGFQSEIRFEAHDDNNFICDSPAIQSISMVGRPSTQLFGQILLSVSTVDVSLLRGATLVTKCIMSDHPPPSSGRERLVPRQSDGVGRSLQNRLETRSLLLKITALSGNRLLAAPSKTLAWQASDPKT